MLRVPALNPSPKRPISRHDSITGGAVNESAVSEAKARPHATIRTNPVPAASAAIRLAGTEAIRPKFKIRK